MADGLIEIAVRGVGVFIDAIKFQVLGLVFTDQSDFPPSKSETRVIAEESIFCRHCGIDQTYSREVIAIDATGAQIDDQSNVGLT